ncbi:hypothetical protein [Planococcus rifietoensis]|uniref:hypothetical protein n=1 Tax=Planococcus rifietoensis TaxID=200991 RepID=UPI0038507324
MKKILLGIVAVIILAGGLYGYQSYKDYQDYQAFRDILYDVYIPDIKETAPFMEKYADLSPDLYALTEWQVEEGYDLNLDFQRHFDEVEQLIGEQNVSAEKTKMLKTNVLDTLNLLDRLLTQTYDSEKMEYIDITLASISENITEMNAILNE